MISEPNDAVTFDINAAPWQKWSKPGAEGRAKIFESAGKRIRILELPPGFDEKNWCQAAHQGYVMKGTFTILLEDRSFPCRPGMAFSIPNGVAHRSQGSSDEKTVVFVVDDFIAST
jgi:quercetin dioxygenase-like cupin family protein